MAAQECKSLNGRLVNYLKTPAVLRQLLAYIVELPEPGALPSSHG
jgi:hypothetical protein